MVSHVRFEFQECCEVIFLALEALENISSQLAMLDMPFERCFEFKSLLTDPTDVTRVVIAHVTIKFHLRLEKLVALGALLELYQVMDVYVLNRLQSNREFPVTAHNVALLIRMLLPEVTLQQRNCVELLVVANVAADVEKVFHQLVCFNARLSDPGCV